STSTASNGWCSAGAAVPSIWRPRHGRSSGPGPALRALTLDRAAMHVSVAGAIEPGLDGVLALDLADANFERLMQGIEAGFLLEENGKPILIEGGSYGEYDLFYEGTGWFNALFGCNQWTAAALRAA